MGRSALAEHVVESEDRGLTALDRFVEGAVSLDLDDRIDAAEFGQTSFDACPVDLQRGKKRASVRLQDFKLGGIRSLSDGLKPSRKPKRGLVPSGVW